MKMEWPARLVGGMARSTRATAGQFLRCDRCGAGWPSNRLQCPFCDEDDHRALRSLFAQEDQDRCRLVLCDGCGGRLKVITTLAPISHPGLVVAQFTMLYLDFIDEESNPRESS
jgi:formate dehydrogenase maturation protein FdhE